MPVERQKWRGHKPRHPPSRLPVTLNGSRFKLLGTKTVYGAESAQHQATWQCLRCGLRIAVLTPAEAPHINDPETWHPDCPKEVVDKS